MDEPKGTKQGELQRDAGQTSQGTEGTSQNLPETLTREVAQKMVSDALAKQGRELKATKQEAEQYKLAHSQLETELTETRNRLSDIQRRIDEAEEEEAKGSTETMRQYQRQKQLRDQETMLKEERRKLEKERAEHSSELTSAKETKVEMSIISSAVEHHVDIEKLKEKAHRLGLTTNEQISELAETMAGQITSENDGKKKIPVGDSGKTIGASSSYAGMKPKDILKTLNDKIMQKGS